MLLYLQHYKKTIVTFIIILITLVIGFSPLRLSIFEGLWPFFQWLETTWFGVAGKTWGALFATVEAFHLLALAVLGGAILVSNGRLLGFILVSQPANAIVNKTHHLFIGSMIVILSSGVFMVCGLATRVYYLPVFWYKMLALGAGLLFEFFIRKPLLNNDIDSLNPWILRAVAVSSLMIWFTVAATGRWIGYAG